MIAKKETVNLRGANGSPKTAGILSMPASQAAVHHPLFAGSGRPPDPLITKKKGVI